MDNIRLCKDCVFCLINKYANAYPEGCTEEEKLSYIQSVLKIISEADLTDSAPTLVAKINTLQKKMWGTIEDYTDIKHHFNNIMLSLEDEIKSKINSGNDCIQSALKYSMMGNYIDFGAVENVDEKKLFGYINSAEDIEINQEEIKNLKKDLREAKKLVYITDNCGEIVTDKILIEYIIKEYPDLKVEVLVRGGNVLNDATITDAKQIGLTDIVPVFDNGTQIAGTCLDLISETSKAKIEDADVVIAKGQGNFETLRFCKKNIYYLFMCKCEMFAKRFDVKRYSGMMINDLRM